MEKPFRSSFCRSSFKLNRGLTIILGLMILSTLAIAADSPVVGDWEGTLNPGAQPKKRVVVHITAAQDGSLSGAIDYPDQDTSGILLTAITFKDPAVHFESTPDLSAYDGTLNKEKLEITGTWKQGGKGIDLVLRRTR